MIKVIPRIPMILVSRFKCHSNIWVILRWKVRKISIWNLFQDIQSNMIGQSKPENTSAAATEMLYFLANKNLWEILDCKKATQKVETRLPTKNPERIKKLMNLKFETLNFQVYVYD